MISLVFMYAYANCHFVFCFFTLKAELVLRRCRKGHLLPPPKLLGSKRHQEQIQTQVPLQQPSCLKTKILKLLTAGRVTLQHLRYSRKIQTHVPFQPLFGIRDGSCYKDSFSFYWIFCS